MTKMIAEKAFIRGQDSLKGKKFTSIEEVKKIVADYYWNFVKSDEEEAINQASQQIYQLFSPPAPVEGLREAIAKLIKQAILDYSQDSNPKSSIQYYCPSVADSILSLLSTHIDQIAGEKGYVKLASGESVCFYCVSCERMMQISHRSKTHQECCDECYR